MIFHRPTSWAMLKKTEKRAESFAAKGAIDLSHRLAPAWENTKMMLDASDCISVENYVMDLRFLDWFATKLDDYSKSNILKGDSTVAAILYEWRERMPLRVKNIPELKLDEKTDDWLEELVPRRKISCKTD